MSISSSTIIGVNTVFLYLMAAGLLVFWCFLLLRTAMRKRKLSTRGETGRFESLTRTDKRLELKLLFQCEPVFQEMFTWLDARLMEHSQAREVRIMLLQDWYNEDHTGKSELPIQTRPGQLIFCHTNRQQIYEVDPARLRRTVTPDELKLLCWGITERCRALMPFRIYKTRVNRVTRSFRIENGAPVCWKTYEVTKEDYTMEIY